MRIKSSLAFLKRHVLPAVICFGAAYLLASTSLVQKIENLTLDERTKLRAHWQSTVPTGDLVLIGVDESSLHELGQWPFSREIHGDFLALAGKTKPSVVAWDVVFPEPTPEDELFVEGVRRSGTPVIFGAQGAEAEEGVKPTDEVVKTSKLGALTRVEGDLSKIESNVAMSLPAGALAQVAGIGFVDIPPEADGVRRNVPLVVRIGDQIYPTLSLRTLMEYWHAQPENVLVRLGDAIILDAPLARRRIPIDEAGRYPVNYRHALRGFLSYGYFETILFLKARSEKTPDSLKKPIELTGRILLIGQIADGLADFGPTPFSPLTPLVLIQANVIENVLREDYVRQIPGPLTWLGWLAVGVVGLAQFSHRRLREQMAFLFGIPIAYVMVAIAAWMAGSWLVTVVAPVFGFLSLQIFMIARRVMHEQRAKEQIRGMFGTYVSPTVVSRIIESGEMPRLGGYEEEITAYFSDIQSFSAFSEIIPADRLVPLMNEYLTACADIVQEEGGTLDKFIGDAVVTIFGAPVALPDHAYRACVATQRVQQKQAELREKWKSEGDRWPEIVWRMQTRIGLNSGSCVVGNMGSRTRFNYTMMGDNVNLAARMESGAKQWGAYTMCTESTKLECGKHGGDRVVFRALGRIQVMGRSQPVPIYEIVGLKAAMAAQVQECVGIFEEGLARYYDRDWDRAIALFQQSVELEFNAPGKTPGVKTNPSLVYLAFAEEKKLQPPPNDWDRVFVMKEK